MPKDPPLKKIPEEISSRYEEAKIHIEGINVQIESVRYRMLRQLLGTTLALAAGIITSLISIKDLFGQVPKLSNSIQITASIAVGITALIAVASFTIKRLADRRSHADQVQEAIEAAYFRALDRSPLNPKSLYSRHVERTN